MDSLTQIVLGAACGEAVAGRKMGAKAALYGAIGGTIPDLDVFLRGMFDPFDGALAHRGFSHSFVFAALMTPILGTLFYKLYKEKYARKTWMWLWFLSIVTHPLLDIFTNYGTQFLWPFPNRITFNTVFVIDPLYTVPFMICVIVALFLKRDNPKRRRWNMAGIYWSCGYLLWGVIVKLFILANVSIYDKRFADSDNIMVTPMPLTSFYWQIVAKKDDEIVTGYKSLLHEFRKEDIETWNGDGTRLEQIDWRRNDRPAQVYRITNGFFTVRRENNGIRLNDFRFGVTTLPTGKKIHQPIMQYMIELNGNHVTAIRPASRGKIFSEVNLRYYLGKVFGK